MHSIGRRRFFMTSLAGAGLTLAQTVPTTTASSQSPADRRSYMNANVVGIVGARRTGTMTELAEDLQLALNDDDLRVLVIHGRGSVGNIEDLLYLRGVDLAFVQSDVLSFFLTNDIEPNITGKIRYIASVGYQKAHLIVRNHIFSVDDLRDRRVNLGFPNSGSQMSGSVLLERLDVNVQASTHGHRKAMKLLRDGELDGMFWMGGAPVPGLQGVTVADGIKLLDIPAYRLGSDDTYRGAVLSSDEYPDLVPAGKPVTTVAVETILAAYNWKRGHPRYYRLATFAAKLAEKQDELRNGDYHLSWRNLDLQRDVPGWAKFG